MNILFFITPKSETAYLYDDCSLRQAIEKIEYHKYTAVPVLNKKGCYVGTLTEGDLLRIIKERYLLNYHEAEDIPLWQVPKRWNYESVNINSNIEDLIEMRARKAARASPTSIAENAAWAHASYWVRGRRPDRDRYRTFSPYASGAEW